MRVANSRQVASPSRSPRCGGWPTGAAWLSVQGQMHRSNFVNLAVSAVTDGGSARHLWPADKTPAGIVDAIAARLGVALGADARAEVIDYVNSRVHGGQVVPDPLDPENEEQLVRKTRGVLYLVGQHPDGNLH